MKTIDTSLFRHLSAVTLCLSAILLIASCDKDKDGNNSSTNANALPLNNITTRGATGSDFTDGQQLTAKFSYESTTKTATLTYNSADSKWNSTGDAFYWQNNTTKHTLLIYSAGNSTITLPTAPVAAISDKNYYLKEDRLYYRYTGIPINTPILLEHALAKLTVKLQPGSDMTADELTGISVKISEVYTQGTVNTTTGNENEGKAGNGSASDNITLCQPSTTTQEYCTLLIPGQELMPVITVNINGTDYTYTATQGIITTAGQNHTYTLSLNRTGITGISATVEEWSGNDDATEIQMNEIMINNNSEGGLENLLKTQGIEDEGWKYNKVIITGTLSDADYATLRTYVNKGKIRGIKLPAEEEIPNNAFNGCSNLISIYMEGVTKIGNYAFASSGLTNVTIPASVTSWGEKVFGQCTLKTMHIYTTAVPGWAIFSYGSLETLYIHADIEGDYNVPYSFGKSPTTLYIGTEVTSLRTAKLVRDNLTSVVPVGENPVNGLIKLPDNVTALADNCFIGYKELKTIESWNKLTSIGGGAFDNTGITSIPDAWPENLTNIGSSAFANTSITSIPDAWPENLTSIGGSAFRNTSITSIPDAWPTNLKSIGSSAFANTGITSIPAMLPNNLRLEDRAFENCTKLTDIQEFIGKVDFDKIGTGLFYGCSGITKITIPRAWQDINDCKSIFNGTGLAEVDLNGITVIPNNTFNGCKNLTSIDLKGVTKIGERAFNESGLTSITIPASVTSWGKDAFRSCPLKTIYIYTTEVVGSYVFSECTPDAIYIHANIKGDYDWPFWYESPLKTLYIGTEVTSLRTANLVSKSLTSVVPVGKNPVNGLIKLPDNVTVLVDNCFSGCKELKTIESWNKLTSIGSSAFANTSITSIPDTWPASLTNIGGNAFENTGITSIPAMLPDKLILGNEVFKNCTELTDIQEFIGKVDFDKIGTGLFYGCSGITKITIPRAWQDINDCKSIFNGTGLAEVDLNGITVIPNNTFNGCKNLTSIDLKGVTKIGERAFNESGLTSITIPASVTSWGKDAFRSCPLKTIYIYTTEVVGSYVFSECTPDAIYIHANIKGDYDWPFWYESPLKTLYIGTEVTSLRTANLVSDKLTAVVVESATPPGIASGHTPFTSGSNPALYLPGVSASSFNANTWKAWGGKNWGTIYYDYKGGGADKASAGSYTKTWTAP